MDIGPLHLEPELLLWAGFILFGSLLIVFRNWWITLVGLLGEYLLLCLLLSWFPFVPPDLILGPFAVSQIVLVKGVAAVTIVAILAITVVLRRRRLQDDDESLDEITAARLRWAVRRAARRGEQERFRLANYLLPIAALAVLVIVTHALAILYPLVRSPSMPESSLWIYVDLVWYWLGLSGILIVLLAQEMQEVSVGLLLCIGSVDLLCTALSRSEGLLAIGLLSAVSILVALGSAYLAQIFYLRLRRWQLPSADEWD
jgi:hypothetical protein